MVGKAVLQCIGLNMFTYFLFQGFQCQHFHFIAGKKAFTWHSDRWLLTKLTTGKHSFVEPSTLAISDKAIFHQLFSRYGNPFCRQVSCCQKYLTRAVKFRIPKSRRQRLVLLHRCCYSNSLWCSTILFLI